MIFWNLSFFNSFFFVKPMVIDIYWLHGLRITCVLILSTLMFSNVICCLHSRDFCLPVSFRLHFKFHIWIYDTWWRQSIVVERPCDKMRKLIWIYNDHLLFLFLFQGISEESYSQNTPADEGRRQIQISHNHSTIVKDRHTRTTQVCCQRWKVG